MLVSAPPSALCNSPLLRRRSALFISDHAVTNVLTRTSQIEISQGQRQCACRMTAAVATKMSVPILFACALLGVRVTCGADPLLALRSRRSFGEIGLSLPQHEIRPLAPSFFFQCDSCLDHRGRVSFGSKNAQCNIVPSLMVLALYGVFERLRHAMGFRVTSHVAFFFFPRWQDLLLLRYCQATLRPVKDFQSSLSSTEALLSNGRSAKISFPGLLFRNTDDLCLP